MEFDIIYCLSTSDEHYSSCRVIPENAIQQYIDDPA